MRKGKEISKMSSYRKLFFFLVETYSGHNTEDRLLFRYVVLAALPRGKLAPAEGTSCLMLYV